MADYDLYYWPMPFRGQFIRALLAHAGKDWREHDAEAIGKLMEAKPAEQPIAFMGPPVLVDRTNGFALAQMPAIALYLGETLKLLPDTPQARAVTAKIVNDANDVIDELTLNGGRQMWSDKSWAAFLPRLRHWMTIWESTAARPATGADDAFLLGTPTASVVDIVTATLWGTMGDRLPPLAALLESTAPRTAALTRRVNATAPLAQLSQNTMQRYGDAYCGGQIEASLRKVVMGHAPA